MLIQRFHFTQQKEALKWILDNVKQFVGPNTLIDAGHFILRVDDYGFVLNGPDAITALGFEAGIELKKAALQESNVQLSFLVGDFAYPEKARKEAKRTFNLPKVYQLMLNVHGFSEQDILFFFESHLRNRAARKMSGFHKANKVFRLLDVWRLKPETTGMGDILAKATGATGSVCLPFCRYILAQKLIDEQEMGFARVINIYDERMYLCRGNFAQIYYSLFQGTLDPVVNVYIIPEERENEFTVEIKIFKPKIL